MHKLMILAGLGMMMPMAAVAQDAPPQKIRSVTLFGNDKCPKPKDKDEIVVCSRAGESPYRIPEKLRRSPPDVAHQAWANKVQIVEDANRHLTPNSCSVVGTDGQTGCTAQMLREWNAERRKANSDNPGD